MAMRSFTIELSDVVQVLGSQAVVERVSDRTQVVWPHDWVTGRGMRKAQCVAKLMDQHCEEVGTLRDWEGNRGRGTDDNMMTWLEEEDKHVMVHCYSMAIDCMEVALWWLTGLDSVLLFCPLPFGNFGARSDHNLTEVWSTELPPGADKLGQQAALINSMGRHKTKD